MNPLAANLASLPAMALLGEVDYYTSASIFPTQPMPHENWHTTIQPIEGGYEHHLFLPEPLRRGQNYGLALPLHLIHPR